MKKLIVFLLIFISLFLFSCKNSVKTIKIGINTDFPPFSYKDNGKLTGFNVDFINLLLKELNLKGEFIEIEGFDFDKLINREADILIGGYPLKYKYPKGVSISLPYFDLSYYLISKLTSPIDSIDALQDKILILPLYTYAEELIKSVKNLTKLPYKNFNDAIKILDSGDADAILVEKVITEIYKIDENKYFKMKVFENGLTIVLRDEDDDLRYKINSAISKIVNGKNYKNLILKWFEEER